MNPGKRKGIKDKETCLDKGGDARKGRKMCSTSPKLAVAYKALHYNYSCLSVNKPLLHKHK